LTQRPLINKSVTSPGGIMKRNFGQVYMPIRFVFVFYTINSQVSKVRFGVLSGY